MKPLTDVPVNHVRRNGNVEQRQDVSRDANPQVSTLRGKENAISAPEPSSILGMLKNTTETGDVGQFSVKSNRKPVPGVRASPAIVARGPSNPRRHPDLGGHFDIHHDRRRPTGRSRFDDTPSSASSSLSGHGIRTYHGPFRDPSLEEHRSYSLTQSSYVSHSLTNRHPYLNEVNQARAIGLDGRPRSPFAYPTRLKRPGYRPSSPALSDIIRHGYYSRPSSRPASPASMYSMHRPPNQWHQNSNLSDPSLRHYPTSHVHGRPQFRTPSPVPSQPSTPRPASTLRSVASSSQLPRNQILMQNMWTHQESPPPSPLFYDYTEAFEGLHQSHHISMSTMILNESIVGEAEQGISQPYTSSSRTAPSELPTDEYAPKVMSKAPNGSIPASFRLSANQLTEPGIAEPEVDRLSGILKDPQSIASVVHPSEKWVRSNDGVECTASESTVDVPASQLTDPPRDSLIAAGNDGRASIVSTSAKGDTASLKVSEDDGRSPSSSIGSMRTAESNSRFEQEEGSEPSTPVIPGAMPKTQPATPRTGNDEDTQAANDTHIYHQKHPQTQTFERHSMSEHSQIMSPTPERSIISSSNHDRFSKILGLDDSMLDLENAVDESCNDKMPAIKGVFKAPMRIRDSVLNNSTVNTSILEESDSEEESELYANLLQTFGRRFEHHTQDIVASTTTSPGPISIIVNPPIVSEKHDSTTISQESMPDAKSGSISETRAAGEPEMSRPPRHSAAATQHRHAQVLSSNSKPILLVDKKLPPVPRKQHSFVGITPPADEIQSGHPFAFTPLINKGEGDSIVELEAKATALLKSSDMAEGLEPPPVLGADSTFDRDSVASSHGSRPWNNDSNYPWSNQPPVLDVTIPQPEEEKPLPTGRVFPRFKLRIHRASSSTTRTSRLTKHRQSTDDTLSSKRSSGHSFIKSTTFKRKAIPIVPTSPGQNNSSRDIGNHGLQTRFVESFDPPPRITTVITSPTITLLPPSPGHEVQSFFSDDSSQARPKGSLRKRLSEFRARHSQTNSTDEVRGFDRGLLSSALGRSRTSGRSSRQSQNTAGTTSHASHIKHVRSKVVNKVRFWWQRSGARIRHWRSQCRQDRSRNLHADLYSGP